MYEKKGKSDKCLCNRLVLPYCFIRPFCLHHLDGVSSFGAFRMIKAPVSGKNSICVNSLEQEQGTIYCLLSA